MGWPVYLHERLAIRLVECLDQYADFHKDHEDLFASAKLTASMLRGRILLNPLETEFLRLVIQEHLDVLDEAQYDEELELAYYKIWGEWAIQPPYFSKRDGLPWPPPWIKN